ncbi:protein ILRUN isoform X2 [Brienomyrus brachyistius]|uniref:protein ILRUN isoform X2 n=1 Tax=Brienomyrus brachyistius TaxID=42636 RepID=UPI0020B29BB8|nr:protein ILRUN isoform X2 [Brienomyrus brachyistius]
MTRRCLPAATMNWAPVPAEEAWNPLIMFISKIRTNDRFHSCGRNLQAAIGAYYDFESPNINAPSMSFVEDVTIGEGESVPPDTPFTKTWRIQNTGAESWPPGVCLKYVGGDQFGHVNMVLVRSLEPQEVSDVSVQMRSPAAPGMYQGQWRMCTATGLFYGDVIWVILSVEVGGLLGVTQQLSSFETEFNTQPHRNVEGNFNPFASPQRNKGSGSPSGPWDGHSDGIQQDQNGLSHTSVNITPNSLQNNLSVVTYSQVSERRAFVAPLVTMFPWGLPCERTKGSWERKGYEPCYSAGMQAHYI